MTDLPDDVTRRLPDEDRIRERIRERRDERADESTDEPQNTEVTDAFLDPESRPRSWKVEEGELMKDGGGPRSWKVEEGELMKDGGGPRSWKVEEGEAMKDGGGPRSWKVEEGEAMKWGDAPGGPVVEESILTTNENVLTNNENILTNNENVLTNNENVLTNNENILTNNENITGLKINDVNIVEAEADTSVKYSDDESLTAGPTSWKNEEGPAVAALDDDITAMSSEQPDLGVEKILALDDVVEAVDASTPNSADEAMGIVKNDSVQVDAIDEAVIDPVGDALAPLEDPSADQVLIGDQVITELDAAEPLDDGLADA